MLKSYGAAEAVLELPVYKPEICVSYFSSNITALQNCLNRHLFHDMVTRSNLCYVFIVIFQTYLVAQVTVERFSLNLAYEINTVLKTQEF